VKEGDTRKYQLSINMGANFNPEDVKVSMKDGVVSVHAKREKVSEDGNSRFYKEVTRRFTLPTTVDAKQLKSALTPDGVLKIEAPLPAEALPEPPKHKEIPVKIE
jgi:HSP20 family molecular chaperone IbpA